MTDTTTNSLPDKPAAAPSKKSIVSIARQHGIGVFATKKHKPLEAEFNYEPQTDPLICALGPIERFSHGGLDSLDGLDSNKKTKYFFFTLANVHFYVQEEPDGAIEFSLSNNKLHPLQQDKTPMNKRAAIYALGVIKDQMSDELLQQKYGLTQTPLKNMEKFKSAYASLMKRLEDAIPADIPLQLKPRKYSPVESIKSMFNAYYNHNMGGKVNLVEAFHAPYQPPLSPPAEAPFADKPLEVLHMPVFRPYARRPLEAAYGAFSFCQNGVSHWVQFKNLDASDASEFIIISPREAGKTERTQRKMNEFEASSVLSTIRRQMTEEQYQRFARTLDRLNEEVDKLSSLEWDQYFKKEPPLKKLDNDQFSMVEWEQGVLLSPINASSSFITLGQKIQP